MARQRIACTALAKRNPSSSRSSCCRARWRSASLRLQIHASRARRHRHQLPHHLRRRRIPKRHSVSKRFASCLKRDPPRLLPVLQSLLIPPPLLLLLLHPESASHILQLRLLAALLCRLALAAALTSSTATRTAMANCRQRSLHRCATLCKMK